LRGVAEANWSMRFLVSLGTSSAISELGMRLPRFARNDRGGVAKQSLDKALCLKELPQLKFIRAL
jgi:hypothetical protein